MFNYRICLYRSLIVKNIVKLVVKNIVKFVLKFILFVYIYNINKFYKYLLFNVN